MILVVDLFIGEGDYCLLNSWPASPINCSAYVYSRKIYTRVAISIATAIAQAPLPCIITLAYIIR